MSKRVARQRKKKQVKTKQKSKKKLIAIICSVFCLTLVAGVMAQWKFLPGSSKPLVMSPPTQGSFAAGSPSKEYIYAGGRLIATEEPQATSSATPTPTPTPPSNQSSTTTENVFWTNVIKVTPSGNSLSKAGDYGWDAGAVSIRAIASGDGYVEVTAGETNAARMFGLGSGDSSQSYEDIEFAIYMVAGGPINIYEGGVYRGSFGTYATGDRLRVAVEGQAVKYYKMTPTPTLLYTSTGTVSYPLAADTSLYTTGATISNAVISGQLTGPIVQNITWANVSGVLPTGNSLSKNTDYGWNAGAISTRALGTGDGYAEFTASETSTNRMFGLSHGDSDYSYTDIDFAIFLDSGSAIQIYEGGSYRGVAGTYSVGDRLRVSVESGIVKYRKNGALIYTSTAVPSFPLLVDTSLNTPAGTITDAVISGNLVSAVGEDISWTSHFSVTPSGNSLTKAGDYGWDAGAVSTKSISTGDGYAEFTASETNTNRMFGLSNGQTDHSYTDIDFAIYLDSGGAIQVYEGGSYRGVVGSYSAGDRLRVSVEGGIVKYRKNGVLLYTSAVTPTHPLLVDTSLYSPGATITNATISGNLSP